jgi:lactate permease
MLFLIPFLVLLISLIFTRKLFNSILYSFISFLLIYPFIFDHFIFLNALLKSINTSISIFILVFSLLSLFSLIENENKKFLKKFKNGDFKVLIILGIYFTLLIEALVGFGTPGMIVVKSLVDIGFNPIISSIVSLLSDSFSSFGAFATPIEIGMKNLEKNFLKYSSFIFSLLIFIVFAVVYFLFGKNKIIDRNIFISLVIFSILFYFLTYSGLHTLSLAISSSISILVLIKDEKDKLLLFFRIFYPFFIIIFIYLILRFLNIEIVNKILNFFGIGIVAFFVLLFFLFKKGKLNFLNYSLKKSIFLFINVFLLSFILFSISFQLSEFLSAKLLFLEKYYLFISPLIGIFGAFIFGSATLSNLTFAEIQLIIAKKLNLDVEKILTLQLVGAGLGNSISLYNILAITSLVDLKDRWFEVFKINAIVIIITSFIISLIFFLV